MKQRIWELDALRGLCILGMVAVHFVYDVVSVYRLADWDLPELFLLVQNWGGVLFLLISGISVTLGRRHVKRGLIVFACGLICSAVTAGMYLLNFAGKGMIIYFGVLHCLGVCMLLWALARRFPIWLLGVLGVLLSAAGLYLRSLPGVSFPWLMPLGLRPYGFISSDYFPLLPNFGYFLIGAFLGKTLYRSKESLFPKVNGHSGILRFLCACGKHSLWIYLLHQPVLALIFSVWRLL